MPNKTISLNSQQWEIAKQISELERSFSHWVGAEIYQWEMSRSGAMVEDKMKGHKTPPSPYVQGRCNPNSSLGVCLKCWPNFNYIEEAKDLQTIHDLQRQNINSKKKYLRTNKIGHGKMDKKTRQEVSNQLKILKHQLKLWETSFDRDGEEE